MTAVAVGRPRSFVVWFRDTVRWDVAFFQQLKWRWPEETIHPVGDAVTRRRAEVHPNADQASLPIIEKISFRGQVSVTAPDDRIGYKGRLFWADAGNLVYSKIRVKQGSLAIVPAEIGKLAVSAEYPVYEINTQVADPNYLALVLRSTPFMRLLEGLSHGGSTKTRIPPEEFERQRIPLPPLAVQRKIVAAWEAARKYAAEAVVKIERLERDIESQFLADLGLKSPRQITLPKAFSLRWKDLDRWSIGFIRMASAGADVASGKYPAVQMGECLVETMNGYCIRPVAGPTPYKMLKLNALRPSGLDLSAFKYIKVPEKIAMRFHLCNGDLLICRSVGSFEHIAKCALVEADEPGILFPDIMIRARFNPTMLPEFAREFIQTKLGRTYFQQNARTAVGMWKIGGADIANLPIPLAPLSVQRHIVERVAKRRVEISRLKDDANARADSAKADVEAMILGMKQVE